MSTIKNLNLSILMKEKRKKKEVRTHMILNTNPELGTNFSINPNQNSAIEYKCSAKINLKL